MTSFSFGRQFRLKKQKDFNLIIKKGKRLYSNSLTMTFFKGEGLKVGICVSKKHGSAVKRNRIKRLVREAVRKLLPSIPTGYRFVLFPKVKDDYSVKEYSRDLAYMLKKSGLMLDGAKLSTSEK